MASYISHTTVDCRDAYALSVWWSAVLDYHEDPNDPNLPGHEECMIYSPDASHRVLFIEVPEAKVAKNRLHFDLRAPGAVADEVARLRALGATVVRVGDALTVMRDPEGNEFCVE